MVNQLISLIKGASFIISNDTGPAHIFRHLDKPGLVFFGSHYMAANYSEEPAGFYPPYVEKRVVYPELDKKKK